MDFLILYFFNLFSCRDHQICSLKFYTNCHHNDVIIIHPWSVFAAVFCLSEASGQAYDCAGDLSRPLHPDRVSDFPRRADSRVSESGGVVVSTVTVLCGHHSHHRGLRRLRTRCLYIPMSTHVNSRLMKVCQTLI